MCEPQSHRKNTFFNCLGDYVDKTELSVSMREVLRCLACRAIKPSPLSPALKLHELERLLSLLAHQTLSSIAEGTLWIWKVVISYCNQSCGEHQHYESAHRLVKNPFMYLCGIERGLHNILLTFCRYIQTWCSKGQACLSVWSHYYFWSSYTHYQQQCSFHRRHWANRRPTVNFRPGSWPVWNTFTQF